MGNNHVIKIIPTGKKAVQADPNPFPGEGKANIALRPGDTVSWEIPPGREMQVVFKKFLELPVNGSALQDCDRHGPFEPLHVEKDRIVGRIRADLPESPAGMQRFLYTLLENGEELEWSQKPPQGAPDKRMGGGIDVPPKPPGSGGGG